MQQGELDKETVKNDPDVKGIDEKTFEDFWEYIEARIFGGDKPGSLMRPYSGQLLVRELFLDAQVEHRAASMPKLMILNFLFVFTATIATNIAKHYCTSIMMEQTFAETLPSGFWTYQICCFMINTMMMMTCVMFVIAASTNQKRQNYMMIQLTKCLEVDMQKKTETSVLLPLVNYMHPPSLLTWMNVRDLVLDTGQRFVIRLQMYNVIFIGVFALMVTFLVAVGMKFIDYRIMDTFQWIEFAVLTLAMSYFAM